MMNTPNEQATQTDAELKATSSPDIVIPLVPNEAILRRASQQEPLQPAPRPKPKLPPVPDKPKMPPIPAAPVLPPLPAKQNTAPRPKTVLREENPSWWRMGGAPILVLLLIIAASDMLWATGEGLGMAAGIFCLLFATAIITLRNDLSRGEFCFLAGMGLINGMALLTNGSTINLLASLFLTLVVLLIPKKVPCIEPSEQEVRYRSWWLFWFAHKQDKQKKTNKRKVFFTIACIFVGLISFWTFICIFATGNPVVRMIWKFLLDVWYEMLEFLQITQDFFTHVFVWIIGFIIFGLYTLRRPTTPVYEAPAPPPAMGSQEIAFPLLTVCALIGINMAFAVTTATDIAFLWQHKIPEGVSQTLYLYHGVESIIWASVLASLILLVIFRPAGDTKKSRVARFFGYLLVFQTVLMAASVYLRLYNQIEMYGFTTRRILASEVMLLGILGLFALMVYITGKRGFGKCVKICFGTAVLMLLAQGMMSPSRVAGELNMKYHPTHPHWKFECDDFNMTSQMWVKDNLPFALYVYRQDPSPAAARHLYNTALIVERNAVSTSWRSFNQQKADDLAAAKEILNDEGIRSALDR